MERDEMFEHTVCMDSMYGVEEMSVNVSSKNNEEHYLLDEEVGF
jgi:hypothetical protein